MGKAARIKEEKQKIDKTKKYHIKELGPIIYGVADNYHGGGKISNTEFQRVLIPTVFLKRVLDLREDFIEKQLINFSTYKLSKNKLTTLKNEVNKINSIYRTNDNNEWFFVSFMDIINFQPPENEDNPEREISLYVDENIKIKTYSKTRVDFIEEIVESFSHKTVKDIFYESRYFDHYLQDRRKMGLNDVDNLFNGFAKEFFGDNVETDLFSQAYIFTISKFASNLDQNEGQFFTPDKLCRLAVGCLNPDLNEKGKTSVCDVASGSGTFLIEFAAYLIEKYSKEEVNEKTEFYLQEKEGQTLILGEAGLLLSGLQNINAYHGDTLLEYYKGKDDGEEKIGQHRGMLDFFFGNPPYGVNVLKQNIYDEILTQVGTQPRWDYGMPPKAEIEWLFVQTCLDMTHAKGRGALVLPLGTMFKKNTRDKMIEDDIVEGIIELPGNMFATTGIPTCIWIFNKNKKPEDKGKIFMINASDDFTKVDGYNEVDIEEIIYEYQNRISKKNKQGYIDDCILKEQDFIVSTKKYFLKPLKNKSFNIEQLTEKSSETFNKIIKNQKSLDKSWNEFINIKVKTND